MTITHILVDFENTQPSAQDVALLGDERLRLWIFRGPSQKKYDAEFAESLLPLGGRVRVIRCEKSGRNALDMHIAFQLGRLIGEPAAAGSAEVDFVVVSRDTDYDPLLQHVRALGYTASRAAGVRAALGAAPAARTGSAKAAKARAAAPAAKGHAAAGKSAAPPAKAAAARHAAPAKARPVPAAKATKTPAKSAAAKSAASVAARAQKPAAAKPSLDELLARVIENFRNRPTQRPTRRDRLHSWLESHLRGKATAEDVAQIVAGLEQRGVVRFEGNRIEYPG
jgi:hypothetical protein